MQSDEEAWAAAAPELVDAPPLNDSMPAKRTIKASGASMPDAIADMVLLVMRDGYGVGPPSCSGAGRHGGRGFRRARASCGAAVRPGP